MAERIIATARELCIPNREDVDRVVLLSRLDLEEGIPPDRYRAVAELLAHHSPDERGKSAGLTMV